MTTLPEETQALPRHKRWPAEQPWPPLGTVLVGYYSGKWEFRFDCCGDRYQTWDADRRRWGEWTPYYVVAGRKTMTTCLVEWLSSGCAFEIESGPVGYCVCKGRQVR